MSFINNLKGIITQVVIPAAVSSAPTIIGAVNPIAGAALNAILKAETLGGNSVDKKSAVMDSVIATAKLDGITLNLNQLSDLVDNLVEALNKTK